MPFTNPTFNLIGFTAHPKIQRKSSPNNFLRTLLFFEATPIDLKNNRMNKLC
jgi:hypothetical protein